MVLSLDRWINKIAVITGASSGIGASIAEKLVGIGINVVGIARRSYLIEEISNKLQDQPGKLYACKADVTKEEDITGAFKWILDNLGPVSILINCAGVIQPTTLANGDAELWKIVLHTNVVGLSIATREAVKVMKQNNIEGHIIHMNSVGGHYVPDIPNVNMYPASKHAVTALAETLRKELKASGHRIKVTSISPACVATKVLETNKMKFPDNYPGYLIKGYVLQTEDIADTVEYVLSTPPHVQIHEIIMKPIGATV